MDTSCLMNDPNGPVYDEEHGMFHLFYQDHLAITPGGGPVYGHACSRDLVRWARLPIALWNDQQYDSQAVFTGSATVVNGQLYQVYPGICSADVWPNCTTGTNLNIAVPANRSDPLLANWTKPAGLNPVVNNTQRDPTSAWLTPHGEWRLTTYDAMLYSTRDFRRWSVVGRQDGFPVGECPSFFALPRATPGAATPTGTAAAPVGAPGPARKGASSRLPPPSRVRTAGHDGPSHVHKTSRDWADFLRPGVYEDGPPGAAGKWVPAVEWAYGNASQRMDAGAFYASKDLPNDPLGRRIMWGWTAYVGPGQGVLSLPREVTWHPALRQFVFAPLAALEALRREPKLVNLAGAVPLGAGEARSLGAWPADGAGRQAEVEVTFELPRARNATFGVSVMAGDDPGASGMLFYAQVHADGLSSLNADGLFSLHADGLFSLNADGLFSLHADAPPHCMLFYAQWTPPPAVRLPAGASLAAAAPRIRVGSVNLSISTQYARRMPNTTLWCCAFRTLNGTDVAGCEAACKANASCIAWTFVDADEVAGGVAQCILRGGVMNTAQTMWRPPQPAPHHTSGVLEPSKLLGGKTDELLVSPSDTNLTIRVYVDQQMSEAFWQGGRVAMTRQSAPTAQAGMAVHAIGDAPATLARAQAWRVDDIWISPEAVLASPRPTTRRQKTDGRT